jgi:hypothetical protein
MHEKYLNRVRGRIEDLDGSEIVEGLLFDFVHFYSSYRLVQAGGRWYRREIRVIRNNLGITSWKDAQGFRLRGRKLNVAPANAEIYHYGWARDPAVMSAKQKSFDRYWHDDAWVEERHRDGFEFSNEGLVPFTGTHPAVMQERIARAGWDAYADPEKLAELRAPRFRRLRSLLAGIGEYRNYKLLSPKDIRESR